MLLSTQTMLKPHLTARTTRLTKSARARYAALRHTWAAAGTKLVQSIRGSKGDQAAFAGDLAVLAAQLADDGDNVSDRYTFAYVAEFSDAIHWSQHRPPVAALQHTDTDTDKSHSTAKVLSDTSNDTVLIECVLMDACVTLDQSGRIPSDNTR